MKKKLLALSLPAGLIVYLSYSLWNRFVFELPDMVAMPLLAVGIALLLVGLVFNGYFFGKRKNPYDFK